MALVEEILLYTAFAAIVASFFLQRFLMRKQTKLPNYQQEVLDILNKEEYKVKGRFE